MSGTGVNVCHSSYTGLHVCVHVQSTRTYIYTCEGGENWGMCSDTVLPALNWSWQLVCLQNEQFSVVEDGNNGNCIIWTQLFTKNLPRFYSHFGTLIQSWFNTCAVLYRAHVLCLLTFSPLVWVKKKNLVSCHSVLCVLICFSTWLNLLVLRFHIGLWFLKFNWYALLCIVHEWRGKATEW